MLIGIPMAGKIDHYEQVYSTEKLFLFETGFNNFFTWFNLDFNINTWEKRTSGYLELNVVFWNYVGTFTNEN